MPNELVMLDLDDTLEDLNGVLPEVPGFLNRQSAKRDCIVVTRADAMVEKLIDGNIKKFIRGFYPRQVVAGGYEYYQDKAGKFFHRSELENEWLADLKTSHNQYKNPFYKGFITKDLHLVKNLHSRKNNQEYKGAVFIADTGDIHCSYAAPAVPCLFAKDKTWAKRGMIEAAVDKLFEGSPDDVFDHLYSRGKSVNELSLTGSTSKIFTGLYHRDIEVRLSEAVETCIVNFRYRLSRLVDGLEARVIQELI
jgi:hypothetical protein